MLFAAVSVTQSLLDSIATGLPEHRDAYRIARGMAYALMNTFGMRMAAVFMFMTSTIGMRTGVLARWVSFVGFACGLVLLLVIADFLWIALLFPLWGARRQHVHHVRGLPTGSTEVSGVSQCGRKAHVRVRNLCLRFLTPFGSPVLCETPRPAGFLDGGHGIVRRLRRLAMASAS